MKKIKTGSVISHIYLILLTFVSIFPLVWILISSVKGKGELTGSPTAFWPRTWTLDYYTHVINDLKFFVNIKNSVIISLVTTLIAITVASLAAYGIVRFFKKLGSAMSKVLVTTYIFPPILLAIPYSVVMGKLGLINTRIGLIIVYLSFSVPYAVWLLTGFFRTVPVEIEEAARIDGAGNWTVFRRITMPLLAPTFLFVSTIAFTNCFKLVDHVVIMTEGAPNNASTLLLYYIYQQGFTNFNYGVSSALTVIMLGLLLVVSLPRFISQDKKIHYN